MIALYVLRNIFYVCLFSIMFAFGEGAIKSPVTQETPIRLTKSPSRTSGAPPPKQDSSNSVKQIQLGIKEPPNGSFIGGTTVYVTLNLMVDMDEQEFRKEYKDARVCLSLDESNWFCWAFDSKIMLSNTVDGTHTLQARLYHKGKLLDRSSSDVITFTTVSDPTIEESHDYHNQEMPEWHADIEDAVLDLDEIDTVDEEGTEVSFPTVQLLTPMDKVSYSGTDVMIDTLVEPENPKQFNIFFRHAYTCFNIDMGTAHFCSPLFQDDKPIVVGLDIGFHTIEASLSNPETGDVLEDSSSQIVFFMAGTNNEGAAFTAEMNLRGKLNRIPVVKGGCITQQAISLCRSIRQEHNRACFSPVFDHLRMIASQVGFFTDSRVATVIEGFSDDREE